jgi:hypothetical protein
LFPRLIVGKNEQRAQIRRPRHGDGEILETTDLHDGLQSALRLAHRNPLLRDAANQVAVGQRDIFLGEP